MMAESHPIYLSQLGIHVEKSKNGRDKAVMILTIVSVGVVVALTPIGKHNPNAKRCFYQRELSAMQAFSP